VNIVFYGFLPGQGWCSILVNKSPLEFWPRGWVALLACWMSDDLSVDSSLGHFNIRPHKIPEKKQKNKAVTVAPVRAL
jgi:hypothetical protein